MYSTQNATETSGIWMRPRSAKAFRVFALVIGLCVVLSNSSQAREFSKAGSVFEDVKTGVVTVFASNGSGSGFLVDRSGLIVTNSHVVNEKGGHLRVKFGPNQIVEAVVVENDREHDIAILRVNLQKISSSKVLELFIPKDEQPLVVGEEIIAIGSPLNRDTLEKNMTLGVIGRIDRDVIYHDAKINHGNSGGPLINYDGRVVGINTFSEPDSIVVGRHVHSTPGPSGTVPIKFAIPSIDSALKKIESIPEPSAELLPDTPEVSYPISKLLKDDPTFFEKRSKDKYTFESTYFTFKVRTPPQSYFELQTESERFLRHRKARAKKKSFVLSDDEYRYKNFAKYYDYERPVVTIFAIPKPKLTTGSVVAGTLGFLTAATFTVATAGAAAPLMAVPLLMGKHEYKKDFMKMSLVDEEGHCSATPIDTGRIPIKDVLIDPANITLEKTYCGKYCFDAKCFDTAKKLKLSIEVEGADKQLSVKFPDKVKTLVVKDFAPYWKHIETVTPAIDPKIETQSSQNSQQTKVNLEQVPAAPGL